MHGPTPLALNGGRVYAEFDSYYQRRARTSITRLYKNIALHDNRRVTVRDVHPAHRSYEHNGRCVRNRPV